MTTNVSSSSSSSGDIGCLSALGIVLITLKLTGNIDWPWWWVLAPFWGGAALALLIILFAAGIALVKSR